MNVRVNLRERVRNPTRKDRLVYDIDERECGEFASPASRKMTSAFCSQLATNGASSRSGMIAGVLRQNRDQRNAGCL